VEVKQEKHASNRSQFESFFFFSFSFSLFSSPSLSLFFSFSLPLLSRSISLPFIRFDVSPDVFALLSLSLSLSSLHSSSSISVPPLLAKFIIPYLLSSPSMHLSLSVFLLLCASLHLLPLGLSFTLHARFAFSRLLYFALSSGLSYFSVFFHREAFSRGREKRRKKRRDMDDSADDFRRCSVRIVDLFIFFISFLFSCQSMLFGAHLQLRVEGESLACCASNTNNHHLRQSFDSLFVSQRERSRKRVEKERGRGRKRKERTRTAKHIQASLKS